ncbi:glucose transporter-like protein [Lineolata rhizophorae]|uniref:Glucose transporter-like protein n=1 Tax=Lineolata rhizophorae TaxID=578093 RepID=A0A6A6NZY7_9PEZI|nr:glucose transporter-like protein [Lineolata rhizophorae]
MPGKFMFTKPADEAGKTWPAIVIGLFVAFGGVLFGYDTGTISGILAMDYWKREFSTEPDGEITPAQDSLIVSILSAGTFFGALFAAPFADILGRRMGLMAAAGLVFNLGVILQTASTRQPMFIAGRFFAGLGVGLVSAMSKSTNSVTRASGLRSSAGGARSPRRFVVHLFGLAETQRVYGKIAGPGRAGRGARPGRRLESIAALVSGLRAQAGLARGNHDSSACDGPEPHSETAPKWIRGTIVGAYQLAITIGLFLAAIVNNGTKDRDDSGSYRIPIAVQFAWSLILVIGLIILPETPRYLIKRDKYDKAAKALSKLRRLPPTDPAIVDELAEIQANHHYELSIGQASYIECFKGTVGKRLLTGCLLQALQQLTGVNFIFYYGTQYFENAGFQNPFIIQVITNSVNVASTFPGLYLVEKMGRRNLLLMGAVGMCVCQYIVAITGTAADFANLPAQKAAIAFVCIYIFFFASSWGPVAWVVTGELFPLKVRAKCLSMTTASNWLLNWAIAYSTPYLVNDGPGNANLQSKVFFIWASFCFVCISFVFFLIYETKGLSLEQVDELYGMVHKAWKSKEFRPKIRFQDVDQIGENVRGMSLADAAAQAERKRSVAHVEGQQQEKV